MDRGVKKMSRYKDDNKIFEPTSTIIEGVEFKKYPLDKNATVAYSIIKVQAQAFKIVIHFENMSINYMKEVDKYFQQDLNRWIIKQPEEFTFGLSQNPVWADKLDFIISPFSRIRATQVALYLIERITKKFGRS